MKINSTLFGVAAVMVFLAIILGFQYTGNWSVSGKVDVSGNAVQPIENDVNSIKGWMTLGQVSETYNVPLNEIIIKFDLPAETSSGTAIKDLESDTFSVLSLREWLLNR